MTIAYRFANGTDPFERGIDRYRDNQLTRFDGTSELIAEQFDQDRATDKWRDHPTYNHNREIRERADQNEVSAVVAIGGLQQIKFKWDMSFDQIDGTADDLAHLCRLIYEIGRDQKNQIKRLFRSIDLEFFIPTKGIAQRTQNAKWWRALLNRECRRRTEQSLRQLGLVSKSTGLYLSNFTFGGWRESERRAAAFMEEAELVEVGSGEIVSMEDASHGSTANLENRRAELMTRIRGCEELATERGLIPLFLTLTCPSKHHLFAKGKNNPRYNGSTPKRAQQHLISNWNRIRAKLNRNGIDLFGLRIVEPHHDGCPHWHLLLFVEPSQRIEMLEIIIGYSLEEDGDEPGANKRRVEIVELDKAGQAAGYVAKYVAKNIDGFKVGEDLESDGQSSSDTAQRVRAWASTWGIRQFQFFGDASVTVYRELRRIANDSDQVASVTGKTQTAMVAADEGNWAAYSKENGGPCCPHNARPIRPYYSEIKPVTGVQRVGVYGDVLRAIAGIKTATDVILSRTREWVLQFKRDSAPWSCVNNCTGNSQTLIY